VPVEGEASAVMVSVDDAVPPAGTVTGLGRVKATPAGATPIQIAARLTDELNPFMDESSIVVGFETSGVNVTATGEGWARKSGLGVERAVPA